MIYMRNGCRLIHDIQTRFSRNSRFFTRGIKQTMRMSLIYSWRVRRTVKKSDCCFFLDNFNKGGYYVFTYMEQVLTLVEFIYNYQLSFKIVYFLWRRCEISFYVSFACCHCFVRHGFILVCIFYLFFWKTKLLPFCVLSCFYTYLYILIVYILLINKVMYKWP